MKTLLIVGSGGREHVLGWKLAQSSRVSRLIVLPGNEGMPSEWERWSDSLSRQDFEKLAQKAQKEKVDLAVIGPDNPLADGIVDVFESYGIPTFGPRAAAAQIEASKAFAKELMRLAGVPTAKYWVVETEDEGLEVLGQEAWPSGVVVKADGLAFGKGVRVCETLMDAQQAVHELIQISGKLVIEEKLLGEEISWMAFCDGQGCALLEPVRDYKRLLDRNEGPNTGGMGAISPVPDIPQGFSETLRNQVFLPVLRQMKKQGTEFRGILYAGLMVDFTSGQYWVLEFNARFGDPEAQALLPRMEGDLLPWCEAVARGDLSGLPASVPFKKDFSVFVVGAAPGYPERPVLGIPIRILDQNPKSYFFAGVRRQGSELLTSGGRVLGALGMGTRLELAREEAYERLGRVTFEGMQFRTDIGRFGS